MASTWRTNDSTPIFRDGSDPLNAIEAEGGVKPFIVALSIGLVAGFVGLLLRITSARRDIILVAALTLFFCRHQILEQILQVFPLPTEAYIFLVPLLCINGLQIAYLYAVNSSSEIASPCTTSSPPLRPLIFAANTSHTRLFPRHHSFKYSYLLAGVPIDWRGTIGILVSSDLPGPTRWWRDAWFSVHPEDYLFYTRTSTSSGSKPPSLREKLNAYLCSEGVDLSIYPYAYLVTAPRVLGFTFNPVSFWYLYSHAMELRAMILEVNNTFGERRMYLLQEEDHNDDREGSAIGFEKDGEVSIESRAVKGAKKFKSNVNKDFHVSPFNDREGVYSLSALDPFAHGGKGAKIDNVITLSSPAYNTLHPELDELNGNASTSTSGTLPSKLSPKIIACISSQSTIDPSALTNASLFSIITLNKYLFVLRHFYMGFLTNPRILFEARKLWSRGLKVWYRPEVYPSTIGKEESWEEEVAEREFAAWLRDAVERIGTSVAYTSGAGGRRGHRIVIGRNSTHETDEVVRKGHAEQSGAKSACSNDPAEKLIANANVTPANDAKKERAQKEIDREAGEELQIKILTPAFYAELIRAPGLRKVWDERCFKAKDGEQMVWSNDVDALRVFIDHALADPSGVKVGGSIADRGEMLGRSRKLAFMEVINAQLRNGNSFFTAMRRATLAFLGHTHHKEQRNKDEKEGNDATAAAGDTVSFADLIYTSSSASTSSPSSSQAADFRYASLRILLADRIALGSTALLAFYGSALWLSAVWVAAWALSDVILQEGIEQVMEGNVHINFTAISRFSKLGLAIGVLGIFWSYG